MRCVRAEHVAYLTREQGLRAAHVARTKREKASGPQEYKSRDEGI